MTKLRVLDLFSGIGGFSLGLERTGGFETTRFVEVNPHCRAVLAQNWPEVPCDHDVTTLESAGPVELVTAGFPCQDISSAGARAGLSGNNSSLFWFVLRTIRLVGRPILLLENVAALLNRGMGDVSGALAQIGYDAEWHCIPASAVGAPHHRDRIWIVAHPERDEQSRQEPRVRAFGRMGRVEQSLAWDRDWQDALAEFRGMDDGLPRSVASTDGYRNAVVPQVVSVVGRTIMDDMAAVSPASISGRWRQSCDRGGEG